jgi:hypothetical protein
MAEDATSRLRKILPMESLRRVSIAALGDSVASHGWGRARLNIYLGRGYLDTVFLPPDEFQTSWASCQPYFEVLHGQLSATLEQDEIELTDFHPGYGPVDEYGGTHFELNFTVFVDHASDCLVYSYTLGELRSYQSPQPLSSPPKKFHASSIAAANVDERTVS